MRNIGKRLFWGCAASAISCLAITGASGTTTPDAAPNVTFTASGTFSNPPVSGSDTLRLAGEPFTISIVANAASVPIQHGPNWAVMSPFKMTGQVHSGLLGPSPINIASGAASIFQLVGPTSDVFTAAFPVTVVGISLTIQATIYLPPGTLSTPLIHPFAPVALTPTNSTITYSDSGASTTLTVSTGTIVGALPKGGGAPVASAISPAISNSGEPQPSAPLYADVVALVRPAGPKFYGLAEAA